MRPTIPTNNPGDKRSRSNRVIRSAVRTAASPALNTTYSLDRSHNLHRKNVSAVEATVLGPTVRKLSECFLSNQQYSHATTLSSPLSWHQSKMIRIDHEALQQQLCTHRPSVHNKSYSQFSWSTTAVEFSRESKTTSSVTLATGDFTSSTTSSFARGPSAGKGTDIAAPPATINIRQPDASLHGRSTLDTIHKTARQLDFACSVVNDATPECDKSILNRSAGNPTIGGHGEHLNDDLMDDLVSIIQRDGSAGMLKDAPASRNRHPEGEIFWQRCNSFTSPMLAPLTESEARVSADATSDHESEGRNEAEYKPANICAFDSVYSADARWSTAVDEALTVPSIRALSEGKSVAVLDTQVQPAASRATPGFISAACNSDNYGLSVACSGMKEVMPFHHIEDDSDSLRLTRDQPVVQAAAVSTPEAMQLMSDNELMRMWIESLPPAHQLPEPILSPKLPVISRSENQRIPVVDIDSRSPVSIASGLHKYTDPDSSNPRRRRYTLVLDLDETLVHAVTQALPDVSAPPDLTFSIEIVDTVAAAAQSPLLVSVNGDHTANLTAQSSMAVRANILVYVRPYAIEFLRQMAEYYEVVVFTASKSEYADKVIDYLCNKASSLSSVPKRGCAFNAGNREELDDDEDDAGSTSSTGACECPSTVSSHDSSGYASTESSPMSPQTSVAIATVEQENDADLNRADEIDCAAALRCTESVLNDVILSSIMPSLCAATCSSSPSSPLPNNTQPLATSTLHKQNDLCVVQHRLYREHCVQLPFCPVYLKDLSRLGRDIERTVIVDNQLLNFALHMDNGIAVRSWHGSPDYDNELQELSNFLLRLAEERVEDVRPYIKKAFGHLKP